MLEIMSLYSYFFVYHDTNIYKNFRKRCFTKLKLYICKTLTTKT